MLKRIKFRSLNIDIHWAKGGKLRLADALRQNLRADEMARVTVENECKTSAPSERTWPSIWARSQKPPELSAFAKSLL